MIRFSHSYKDAYLDYERLKDRTYTERMLTRLLTPGATDLDQDLDGSTPQNKPRPLRFRPSEKVMSAPGTIDEDIRQEIMRVEEMYTARLKFFESEFTRCRRSAHMYSDKKKTQSRAAMKDSEAVLKRLLTTIYRELLAFEDFRVSNHALCMKIVKKRDQLLCPPLQPLYEGQWENELQTLKIGSPAAGQSLLSRVERLYADFISKGELTEAQCKLRVGKGEFGAHDVLITSFKVGVLLTLLLWMLYITLMAPEMAKDFYELNDPSAYVYMSAGGFVIYRWVWGIMAYCWEMGRIDYVSLFDLDDGKHVPNFVTMLSEACTWSILFMVNIIMYYVMKVTYNGDNNTRIHAWWMPASVAVTAVWILIQTAVQKGSHGLISRNMIWDFMRPWAVSVTTRHTIGANFLTSICKIFKAMCYSSCFFYSGTFLKSPDLKDMQDSFGVCLVSPIVHHATVIVCVIPYGIRCIQCARQHYDSLVKDKKINRVVWRQFLFGWMKRDAPISPDTADFILNDENAAVIEPMTGVPHETVGGIDPHTTSTMTASIAAPLATRRARLTIGEILGYMFVWPYTFNMMKYALSLIVILVGAYPPDMDAPHYDTYLGIFYTLSVLSTVYSCYWDFRNDWGLFQNDTEWPLLRRQLKYTNMIWYYYLCLILNPIFRCFWTLSFSPGPTSPYLSLFELLRRCMWGVLRLEWTQINDDKKNAAYLVNARDEEIDTVALRRVNSYQKMKKISSSS